MKRIFLTMGILANITLMYAVHRGLGIENAADQSVAVQRQIGQHMLIGLGALTFATLVHALSFTWFMGTGRFLEETSRAYSLSAEYCERSRRMKYGLLPGMTVSLLLMVATGALGAIADPVTSVSLSPVLGMSDAAIHRTGALIMLGVNILVTFQEYLAVSANADIVDQVLGEVRRIRVERGLPVE